jgi:hypothetical protein
MITNRRANRATFAALAAASTLLLVAPASWGALFISTGAYDEQAVEINAVDQSVGVKNVATFTTDVLAAFNAERGGVIDFQTGFTNPGGTQTVIGNSFDADFGAAVSKTIQINSNKDLHVYFDDTAGQVDTISDDNNVLPVSNQVQFRLSVGSITGAAPREHVSEMGVTVLSRSVFDATGKANVTANYRGGGSTALSANVGNVQGAGDAFFHFQAPPGDWITSLDFDGAETGGPDANKRRLPIDDLAFITREFPVFGTTGVYDEQTNATNSVDQSVGAKTVSEFAADVAAAFSNDSGGVIDFATGTDFSDPQENTIGRSFDAGFGASQSKTLTFTADHDLSVFQNNTAGQVEVVSALPNKDNNLLASNPAQSDVLTLNVGSILGGTPGEVVTEIGLTILSRDQFAANGDAIVTAFYNGALSETLSAAVGNTPGGGDTFFYFGAPPGSWITALTFDGSQSGGPDVPKRRLPIDDLAFITEVITEVIPEPSALLVWSLLAGLGIGVGWWRRKK